MVVFGQGGVAFSLRLGPDGHGKVKRKIAEATLLDTFEVGQCHVQHRNRPNLEC